MSKQLNAMALFRHHDERILFFYLQNFNRQHRTFWIFRKWLLPHVETLFSGCPGK